MKSLLLMLLCTIGTGSIAAQAIEPKTYNYSTKVGKGGQLPACAGEFCELGRFTTRNSSMLPAGTNCEKARNPLTSSEIMKFLTVEGGSGDLQIGGLKTRPDPTCRNIIGRVIFYTPTEVGRHEITYGGVRVIITVSQ